MPGMDGWAVLSELRSDPGTAAIPVIVVSIIDQRPMAIELGAFEYVTKPIHPERLLGLLGRALIGPPTHPILIVDDNPDDRDLISTILSSAGYNVALAAGGSEAVQWLGQHPARLVMLDLMMPKVSGFDVLKSIRETHPTLPVVVVTAKSLTREDQEILDKGLAEVISKEELAREDLLDQIRKTLTRAAV
jgi:CheY-like chemotaxis protein